VKDYFSNYLQFLFTNKILNFFLLNILFFVLSINQIFAINDYRMTIDNIKIESNTKIIFSIFIENLGEELELTSYQCVFSFNKQTDPSNLSFTYIEGSSELINEPNLIFGIENKDSSIELFFVSRAGNDIILSKTLVGIFALEANLDLETKNTSSLESKRDIETKNIGLLDIEWNFEGGVRTMVTGKYFTNITNQRSHEIISSIVQESTTLTSSALDENIELKFGISQNYPNPFNPSTKIKFTLPYESNTSIKIYDILGNQVSQLVNKQLKAGNHEIEFNSSRYSSGIYFYRLQAEDFVETKKMLLIK